ncbi:hypothetical protein sos41_05510 [Alphaproteobacteria bacterium SO-S41]|nr:hypothetical protein sos41_05510 [Alphaproteobacteria bacterium SO-S41]
MKPSPIRKALQNFPAPIEPMAATLRSLVLLAALLAFGATAEAASPACGLLTADEADRAIGGSARMKDGGAEKDGYSDCAWNGPENAVISVLFWSEARFADGHASAAEKFDTLAADMKKRGAARAVLEDVADRALVVDESSPGFQAAGVLVLKGGQVVQISARGVSVAAALGAAESVAAKLASVPADEAVSPRPKPPAVAAIAPEPPPETPPVSEPVPDPVPPVAEPQPEPTPPAEPAPEPQPEPAPPPAEPQPEPVPEPVTPPVAEPQPEPAPPAEPAPAPQAEPVPPAEPQPEPVPEPVTPPVAEPQPEPVPPVEPAPEPQPEPVPPPAEPQPEPVPEPVTPPVAEPQPEPAPPVEPAPQPQPEPSSPAEPPKPVKTGSHACPLLPAKTLEAILPGGVFRMEDRGPPENGESNCRWSRSSGSIGISATLLEGVAITAVAPDAAAYFDELEEPNPENGTETLAGVGERAYLQTLGEGEYASFSLSILANGKIAFLNLTGTGRDAAINLGLAAAKKM